MNIQSSLGDTQLADSKRPLQLAEIVGHFMVPTMWYSAPLMMAEEHISICWVASQRTGMITQEAINITGKY